MKRIYCARHVIVEGETSNAREKEAESATIVDKPIVIMIGKKKFLRTGAGGFTTEAAALAWARATHCAGKGKDAGCIVIGSDGDHEAIRICKQHRLPLRLQSW